MMRHILTVAAVLALASPAYAEVTEKQMEDAVKDLSVKQKQLHEGAKELESGDTVGPDEDWTPEQHAEYQKNLQSLTEKQKAVEDAARAEAEEHGHKIEDAPKEDEE